MFKLNFFSSRRKQPIDEANTPSGEAESNQDSLWTRTIRIIRDRLKPESETEMEAPAQAPDQAAPAPDEAAPTSEQSRPGLWSRLLLGIKGRLKRGAAAVSEPGEQPAERSAEDEEQAKPKRRPLGKLVALVLIVIALLAGGAYLLTSVFSRKPEKPAPAAAKQREPAPKAAPIPAAASAAAVASAPQAASAPIAASAPAVSPTPVIAASAPRAPARSARNANLDDCGAISSTADAAEMLKRCINAYNAATGRR